MMHRISGLAAIARDFDAMLIDQFGVIHDGQKLYPHAQQVLHELHQLHIPVIIMTNSGKRAAANVQRIVKMGIAREHFVDCVSSGEVAFQSLQVKRAYLVGKAGEDYGFDPIVFTQQPDAADVMLILGSDAPTTSLDDYRHRFESVSLPAVCCNPDQWMITAQGLQPAPGAIAKIYEAMGNAVTWIGKPYPEIYQFALTKLNAPKRVLCIGDSAEHDVAGGCAAGMQTLLVQQGVSAGVAEAALAPQPDYVCKQFCW
jgi:HAD superfamily hydrolase (TIGR01459 family)